MRKPLYPLLVLLALAAGWLLVDSMARPSRAPEDAAARPAAAAQSGERDAVSNAARAPERDERANATREASPEPAPDSPRAPGAGPGLLGVLVVDRARGTPLAGVPVRLRAPGDADVETIEARLPARGGSADVLRTGADGRVEFEAPPGRPFTLLLNWARTVELGQASVELDALAPGERREVTVELATGLDAVWFGRIVDGSSGAPLAGARVGRLERGTDPFRTALGADAVTSDLDGLVRLDFATWRHRSVARVELDGFAPGFASLGEGHAEPAAALVVRLWRHARLELSVRDTAGRPSAGVDVVLACDGYDLFQGQPWFSIGIADPRWEARTDAEGRAVLAELPAEVALTLELRQDGRVVGLEERALRLEAGERRALERVVGAGCTVTGRTLEADGRPAPGVRLWLLPGSDGRFAGQQLKDAVDTTDSDVRGTFVLRDVAAGEWLVVPGATGDSAAIAPAAVPLRIAPDQTAATIDVPCWRGLYLEGTVVDPDGEPVEQFHVQAYRHDFFSSESVRDGTFSLGPLPPGPFRVEASASFWYADSEPLEAEAGASGLVLRLRHAAELRVRVLDASGNRASGLMLWMLHEQDERTAIGTFTDEAGEVVRPGMLPGTYSLCVSDPSGESGAFAVLHDVPLVPGVERPPVELRLEPGARLRLRVPDALLEGTAVRILRAGRVVALAMPRETPVVSVPPGALEVELARWTADGIDVLATRRVEARAGEETVVELESP